MLVAAGLLLPRAGRLYYLLSLSLDPLSGAWYLLLLVVGGHVGVATAVLGCALLGVLTAVIAIARARERPSRSPLTGPRCAGRRPTRARARWAAPSPRLRR